MGFGERGLSNYLAGIGRSDASPLLRLANIWVISRWALVGLIDDGSSLVASPSMNLIVTLSPYSVEGHCVVVYL